MNVYGDVLGEFMPPLLLSGMPPAEQLRAAMAQVGAVDRRHWMAGQQRPNFTQPVAALNAMSISFGPSNLP
jgi:hypothetical protein